MNRAKLQEIKEEMSGLLDAISSTELQHNPKLYKKVLVLRRLLKQYKNAQSTRGNDWINQYVNPDYLFPTNELVNL